MEQSARPALAAQPVPYQLQLVAAAPWPQAASVRPVQMLVQVATAVAVEQGATQLD